MIDTVFAIVSTEVGSTTAPGWFPVVLAAFYLVSKTFFKWLIRFLVGVPYDYLDTAAWFSVDLLILVVSVSISLDSAYTLNVTTHARTLWFLLLGAGVLVAYSLYGWFLKVRVQERTRLSVFVTVINLFVGFGPLAFMVSQLFGPEGGLR